ncbi:MAG TPA: ActD-like protein [Enhygromyxa sp.]|nr:ActD-like protein [Enhygromyxa sp.]
MTERRTPPDLLVEQLALGELDEAQAGPLRAQLAREAAEGGRDRLAEIATSNEEILADYPPERVAADIRRRAARTEGASRSRSSLWMLAPALTAAVVLIWVVTRDDEGAAIAQHDTRATLVDDGEPEPIRIKGGVEPHLVIDRQTQSGHERLAAGESVVAGDLLQVSYVPAGRREGVIVSIDGAGVVTLHHPSDAAAVPSLGEGDEVPLSHAYELDEAPGFERFVIVTRDEGPLSVAEVLAAAEQLAANLEQAESAPLSLAGEGWMQHSVLLRKPKPAAPSPANEADP